ncbi:MAG: hypothetical protein IAE79_12935 [Anaerolinea sp.]|nr:hypothetical protein [Anaerolinea sp.]
MQRLAIVLLMIMLLGVLAACGSAEPMPVPVVEISLTATDIAYDVNRFEVMAGQPVKVTLRNEGALEHDFSIMEMPHTGEVMAEEADHGIGGHDMSNIAMEPEVHVAPPMGKSLSVEFTPTTPGEYEYFCAVAGHKEAGMVGTLVVTAP